MKYAKKNLVCGNAIVVPFLSAFQENDILPNCLQKLNKSSLKVLRWDFHYSLQLPLLQEYELLLQSYASYHISSSKEHFVILLTTTAAVEWVSDRQDDKANLNKLIL